jgi:hypothetical protein
MLVKNAQKSPPKYRGFGADSKNILFGEGAIGSTLQSMISRPGTPGTWRQGQLIGGREADPGFNPGGSPDKNRMIGGTVIRPTGKIANKGVGEQYELPKRFRGEEKKKRKMMTIPILIPILISMAMVMMVPMVPMVHGWYRWY